METTYQFITFRRKIHMPTRIAALTTVTLVALLAGCASGFTQFYKPATGATPEAIARRRAAPPPENPQVERAAPADSRAVVDAYAKRGYFTIGNSMFNSGHDEPESSAIAQGKAVGADLVLILNPRYTGSVTTSIPLTTPTSSTTYSTGNATAYGSGGSVTAYGSGKSTTYGSTTTYIPITTPRSDYGAIYFVKQHFNLGAIFRDLNDAERQELQSNLGAVVQLVVDNTPAFFADVLVGDLVTAIDGVPVANSEGVGHILRERRGRQITVAVLRKGQRIEKVIQLVTRNQPPSMQ
jgi:hypothetical protein